MIHPGEGGRSMDRADNVIQIRVGRAGGGDLGGRGRMAYVYAAVPCMCPCIARIGANQCRSDTRCIYANYWSFLAAPVLVVGSICYRQVHYLAFY
jgi:hypothetical protein